MSETTLSQAGQATPLALMRQAAGEAPALESCCGVLTPGQLSDPAREVAALATGAAVHDLGWMRRVAVRGEDRFRWLSGMVTNMVNDLAEGQGAWNLVLNAQGRIQGDLHVWRGEAGPAELELEIAASQYDRLLAHLDRFIIMDDVELAPLSVDADGALTGETALGSAGPTAAGVLERLGLPVPVEPMTCALGEWNGQQIRVARAYGTLVPHFELWVRADQIPALWRALVEAGALGVGAQSLERLRIAEGIPVFGTDMVERDLPQETSQMRALHFSKGCYLGQEIVERIRSRGSVHRHLRQLQLDGPLPEPGTELFFESPTSGTAPAGHITSAAELVLGGASRSFALGMIRGEAELRNQPLTYTAGAATGIARLLAAPPSLDPHPTGNQEP